MAKKTKSHKIPYGPVWVIGGPHKGRIGTYDDDDYNIERKCEEAIVYFGDVRIAPVYSIIPFEDISSVTTHALMKRHAQLFDSVTSYKESSLKGEKRARALEELNLIENLLADRMLSARHTEMNQAARVFISHSSKDKQLARRRCQCRNGGHTPANATQVNQWRPCRYQCGNGNIVQAHESLVHHSALVSSNGYDG